jgi:hypothetical protein
LSEGFAKSGRDEVSVKERNMNNATIIKLQILVLVATLAACTPATFAEKGNPAGGTKPQTAAAPEAVAKSPCGNQTFCYDTPDFIATVTQFRTSTDGSGNKMLDAIVHFQNKTDQVLSLGYADGSAAGMDDHGNRYELNKDRGVRGMGVIAGTTPDAKFALQPNGAGDAHFELMWNPKDQIVGATYELELSIREMSRGDDKQWTLGNEILVHYDGLANGSASVSASPAGKPEAPGEAATTSEDAEKASTGPAAGSGSASPSAGSAFMSNLSNGATAASQPCGTATAKAAGAAGSSGQSGAASAVSNTSAAITSISSLFGHKAAAAPAAANSPSASPCAAGTNAAGGAGSTAATKPNKVTQPAATVAAAPAAPARTVTKPAPARQTGVVNALLKQPVTPTAAPKAPAPVAKPATVPPAKKPTPAVTAARATAGGQ